MSGRVRDFYPGDSLYFTCTITIDDVAQDIRNDSLRVLIKDNIADTDAQAALNQTADCATQGLTGIGIFSLAATLTEGIAVGGYWLDITWVRASDSFEKVVHKQAIEILERVSDIT